MSSPRYRTQKLLADQFEMPLEAVRWLINVIEQKFFKSPEEGGLPANKISYEEIVAGEDLHVMRCFMTPELKEQLPQRPFISLKSSSKSI